MYTLGYKIIEIKDSEPKFMFCELDGSRKLTLDIWLDADIKLVKDGTSKKEYDSGFHVLPLDIQMARDYVAKFKNLEHKFLVHVIYKDARRKPTLRSLALLANHIKIKSAFLDAAIPLASL